MGGQIRRGRIWRFWGAPLVRPDPLKIGIWGLLDLRTPRLATEPRDGPTRSFHEKCKQNTPRPEILDSQNLPPKYSKKISQTIPPKIPKCTFWGIFWRYFIGVPEFRHGGYFFGSFRGNSGSGRFGAL